MEGGTFASKAACWWNWNEYLFKLLSYTPRLQGAAQAFYSQLCSHLRPWKQKKSEISVLSFCCSSQSPPVCLSAAAAGVCLMAAKWGRGDQFLQHIHTQTDTHSCAQRTQGPELALYTKSCRAWEVEPVQTTGLHPFTHSLHCLMSSPQPGRIPQPRTLQDPVARLARSQSRFNSGHRSPATPQQCFLPLPELTRLHPHPLGLKEKKPVLVLFWLRRTRRRRGVESLRRLLRRHCCV